MAGRGWVSDVTPLCIVDVFFFFCFFFFFIFCRNWISNSSLDNNLSDSFVTMVHVVPWKANDKKSRQKYGQSRDKQNKYFLNSKLYLTSKTSNAKQVHILNYEFTKM